MVYQVTSKLDFELFKRVYVRVAGSQRPLRLFVRGYPYKLFFFIDADLHLLGTGDPDVRWYPLGTDQSGRCLYSRMVHGSILSLSIGIMAIVITWVLGILIGSIAGYFGGVVDTVVNRFIEVLMSVPSLPLWIALAAALPLDWSIVQVYFSITVVLSILGWTGLARTVRSKFPGAARGGVRAGGQAGRGDDRPPVVAAHAAGVRQPPGRQRFQPRPRR